MSWHLVCATRDTWQWLKIMVPNDPQEWSYLLGNHLFGVSIILSHIHLCLIHVLSLQKAPRGRGKSKFIESNTCRYETKKINMMNRNSTVGEVRTENRCSSAIAAIRIHGPWHLRLPPRVLQVASCRRCISKVPSPAERSHGCFTWRCTIYRIVMDSL